MHNHDLNHDIHLSNMRRQNRGPIHDSLIEYGSTLQGIATPRVIFESLQRRAKELHVNHNFTYQDVYDMFALRSAAREFDARNLVEHLKERKEYNDAPDGIPQVLVSQNYADDTTASWVSDKPHLWMVSDDFCPEGGRIVPWVLLDSVEDYRKNNLDKMNVSDLKNPERQRKSNGRPAHKRKAACRSREQRVQEKCKK